MQQQRNFQASRPQSLQDPFLNVLRRERVPVSIYLVNGIKLQGTIESFDQFVVLLRGTTSQMVYKHAISTVVPARAVRVGPTGAYVQQDSATRDMGADEHDEDEDDDGYDDEDEDDDGQPPHHG